MKAGRKLVVLLLALSLALALGANAWAAETGSITINGTKAGKVYDLYRVFDLTYSGKNVTYTLAPAWEGFFNGVGAKYLAEDNTGKLNEITIGGYTRYIDITEANVVQFAQDALEWAARQDADVTRTAEGTQLVVSGLPLGYYLVYPQGAADKINDPSIKANGSICSLTSTMPDATVHVKATYPPENVTKTLADGSRERNTQVGEKVSFVIRGKVPDTTGYASYTYQLTDTMSEGLTFNADVANMKVKVGGTEIATNNELSYRSDGFALTFNMVRYQNKVGQAIEVTYDAIVNEKAIATLTGNSVVLNYSNDPQKPTVTIPSVPEIPGDNQVTVYTSEIVLKKLDGEDKKPLAGAKFLLKRANGDYFQYIDATDTTEAEVRWTDAKAQATAITTGDDGIIRFKGLLDGTYYLEELEAPAGYNKLNGDREVEVKSTKVGTPQRPVGVSKDVEVENKAGVLLPETGGIGTTIFYALGSVMLLGAAVLLIARRRAGDK